jgi:hypothetical protein
MAGIFIYARLFPDLTWLSKYKVVKQVKSDKKKFQPGLLGFTSFLFLYLIFFTTFSDLLAIFFSLPF